MTKGADPGPPIELADLVLVLMFLAILAGLWLEIRSWQPN